MGAVVEDWAFLRALTEPYLLGALVLLAGLIGVGCQSLSPAPSCVCRSLPCMPAACSQDGPYNRSAEAHTGHLGLGFRSGVVGGCPGWSAAPPTAAEDLAVG